MNLTVGSMSSLSLADTTWLTMRSVNRASSLKVLQGI